MSNLAGILGDDVTLEHVGIASLGLDHPIAQLVGRTFDRGKMMPSGVRIARDQELELVLSGEPGNPVERFLDRRGPGLHHIAFGVRVNLDDVRARLAVESVEVVGEIEMGSDGRRTLFIHPRSMAGVLVELVEVEK